MSQNNKKQYAGVCLNNNHAIIIANSNENEPGEYTIQTKVDAPNFQSSGSEHNMNNAKHADAIKYHKSVSSHLLNYDEILIFGTGKSQEQLQNFLKEDMHFNNKKISIDTAENLTDPQMIAKVRDFFKS